jgi:HrpA-like RNA helicase
VTLITAETGSGKTTRILFLKLELPQFLVQAGYTLSDKKIAVVLPRKIAALSIAKRISN